VVRGAMVWLIGPGPARSHPKRHSRTLHVEPRHVLLSSHSVHLIAHMESVCSPTNVANRLLTSTRGRGVVNLHRSRPPDAANRERMSFCCAASLSSKTPHKRRLPSKRTGTCHNLYLGIDFTVLLANRNVQAGPHNVFYLPCGDATTCSHTKAAKIYTGTFS